MGRLRSLREEEQGAEHNKVDRARAQFLLGSTVSELALSRSSQTSRRWGALSSFPVLCLSGVASEIIGLGNF